MHTPSENVSLRAKNAANASRSRCLEQDGLCPALACSEHVAIGESAAHDQTAEILEPRASCDQVGHVNVVGCEAGSVERGRHLDMAVYTLLAQDCDARSRAARDVGRRDVGMRVRT